MVICLERVADLHMSQLMPLPLTVSYFSKIQIGFTFLVPAHPDSPGKRAVKCVCVCVVGCRGGTVVGHRTALIPGRDLAHTLVFLSSCSIIRYWSKSWGVNGRLSVVCCP